MLVQRWSIIKEQREKLEAYKRSILQKRKGAKLWTIYTLTHMIPKILFEKFSALRKKKFREFAEKYYGNMLKRKFLNYLRRFGVDTYERTVNNIKQSLNTTCQFIHPTIETTAKNKFVSFLRDTAEKDTMFTKFMNYYKTANGIKNMMIRVWHLHLPIIDN